MGCLATAPRLVRHGEKCLSTRTIAEHTALAKPGCPPPSRTLFSLVALHPLTALHCCLVSVAGFGAPSSLLPSRSNHQNTTRLGRQFFLSPTHRRIRLVRFV
ncbi:uncharacterized protein LMH87_008902 [Akanthomyces muscarius]|uniref:Uncharacterized protein n=1 Tax=Akanthomyces muscarius TaxID=2231603 RepID=A0A9W8QIX9_AKAMU|nr:uncharacterized protein LMH87_008902 [Akanthomyces muscarius]KAJ4158373.1 hypothetical protein LMH87_008902 [Akanthomyces muscarius]